MLRSTALLAVVPLCLAAPARSQEDAAALAAALNAFAGDLHGVITADEPAPVFAPASVGIALLMLLEGARGDTAAELRTALHLPDALHDDHLRDAAGRLLRGLGVLGRPDPKKQVLFLADDLWAQTGGGLQQPFADVLRRCYGAEVHAVDFVHASEQARTAINQRVAAATMDRIRDLVPPDLLTPSTRFVLTNALWFKAAWKTAFAAGETRPETFHLDAQHGAQVPTMHLATRLVYAADDELQVVELPYASGSLVFEVAVPRPGRPLAAAAARLHAVAGGALEPTLVDLQMPRFTVTGSFRLSTALKALGIAAAFDPGRADLTGIDGGRSRLVVDEVVHRTWVDVDEQGTEAAAATAIVTKDAGAAPPTAVKMTVDRPFAFAIRDRSSGLCVIEGRVLDPRPAGARRGS
jgi:serpin B